MMNEIKICLSRTFSMKDLGDVTYEFEIRICTDRMKKIIKLSQKLYIENFLKRFSMKNSKRELLPFTHSLHLFKDLSQKTNEE